MSLSAALQERMSAFATRLEEVSALKEYHDKHELNINYHDLNPTKGSNQTCSQHDQRVALVWRAIDTDTTLLSARKWGVYREFLYPFCITLGIDKVKGFIDLVGSIPTVNNKAAYLCKTLKNAKV